MVKAVLLQWLAAALIRDSDLKRCLGSERHPDGRDSADDIQQVGR